MFKAEKVDEIYARSSTEAHPRIRSIQFPSPPASQFALGSGQWEASAGDQRVGGKTRCCPFHAESLWISSICPSQALTLDPLPSFCPFQLKIVMGPHGWQHKGTVLSSIRLLTPGPSFNHCALSHHSPNYPLAQCALSSPPGA